MGTAVGRHDSFGMVDYVPESTESKSVTLSIESESHSRRDRDNHGLHLVDDNLAVGRYPL